MNERPEVRYVNATLSATARAAVGGSVGRLALATAACGVVLVAIGLVGGSAFLVIGGVVLVAGALVWLALRMREHHRAVRNSQAAPIALEHREDARRPDVHLHIDVPKHDAKPPR